LAEGTLPSAGQLFFCDSLVDIGAGDLAQAVVELGTACELEVYSTVAVALRGRKAPPDNLRKVDRLSFARKVKLLGCLTGNSFKRFNANAARLVNKLYAMRGAAIHRAHLPFVDSSKSPMWNASQLVRFVQAVESLFGWLDLQREGVSVISGGGPKRSPPPEGP
jgi:hypothetical protein